MADDMKCPVTGDGERHWLFKGKSLKEWWPKLLNLEILHQNHPFGHPMDDEFN